MIAMYLALAAGIIAAPGAQADASAPVVSVQAHGLQRRGSPEVTVRVPRSARYVGGEHFTLYGNADCELHLFVEADAHRHVQRLYWI